MRKNSCLPQRRGTSLCHECGPNIDTEHVDFSREEKNLVYMDKVYSYNQATSCPLLSSFTSTSGNSAVELKLEPVNSRDKCACVGRGCNLCCPDNCVLEPDAVFNIDRSFVLVESFMLSNPECLKAEQVTVDGFFADNLSFTSGQFAAATNNLLPQILKDRCQDLSLPTKAYFLIMDAGPWVFRATFVLQGTVNTCGRTCCFQARIKTADCFPRTVNGLSNFAIPNVSLPCSVNGIAPVINFQFMGGVSMLNPELTFVSGCGGSSLVLETNLVIEPMVNVEVVRRTLFCVDACEALLPCDGTIQQFETAMEDECEWPPPPACRCGTAPTPEHDAGLRDRGPLCNFDDDDHVERCGCSNAGCEGGCGWNSSFIPRNKHNGCNGCSW